MWRRQNSHLSGQVFTHTELWGFFTFFSSVTASLCGEAQGERKCGRTVLLWRANIVLHFPPVTHSLKKAWTSPLFCFYMLCFNFTALPYTADMTYIVGWFKIYISQYLQRSMLTSKLTHIHSCHWHHFLCLESPNPEVGALETICSLRISLKLPACLLLVFQAQVALVTLCKSTVFFTVFGSFTCLKVYCGSRLQPLVSGHYVTTNSFQFVCSFETLSKGSKNFW